MKHTLRSSLDGPDKISHPGKQNIKYVAVYVDGVRLFVSELRPSGRYIYIYACALARACVCARAWSLECYTREKTEELGEGVTFSSTNPTQTDAGANPGTPEG